MLGLVSLCENRFRLLYMSDVGLYAQCRIERKQGHCRTFVADGVTLTCAFILLFFDEHFETNNLIRLQLTNPFLYLCVDWSVENVSEKLNVNRG